MDHYSPFRNETDLRRPQSSSSLVPRSPTTPPVRSYSISPSITSIIHSTSPTASFFDDESPSSIRTQSPTTNHGNSLHEDQGQHDSLFQMVMKSLLIKLRIYLNSYYSQNPNLLVILYRSQYRAIVYNPYQTIPIVLIQSGRLTLLQFPTQPQHTPVII